MQPQTHYAKSADVHIAYQVIGEGPLDLVFVPGFVSHVEASWQYEKIAKFFNKLASFSRLILFDKRGTGLSDRSSQLFTLEQRMDDVRAVMDAADSDRAAIFGISEGGPMSILFAATYPERTSALIMYGAYAKRAQAKDYPFGWRDEEWVAFFDNVENHWGTPQGLDLTIWAPSVAHDKRVWEDMGAYMRSAASPGAVRAVMQMNREIDVRHVLPTIRVPTLIAHRIGDRNIRIQQARYMAERIPGAKFVELPGDDHMAWYGDVDALLGEVEEFLTGVRHEPEPDRVLATILFTDIVDATEKASEMGDQKWSMLLTRHHDLIREELNRFRGREIDTAGDGFFATFDGPARAINCAKAVRDAVTKLGLTVRIGLHTGECEVMDGKISGIAVHIGSRVVNHAAPGEILVTSTVKDLVAGSGLSFVDRSVHELKGVPGKWHLFEAVK
jgi:class 3 adenylate cyclase/alpha-beta hydrolase superfamily lysophospholipase